LSEAAQLSPPATGWATFGHDAALRILDSAQRAGRLSHAYLITGPDQVGRRTLALDLACLLNSEPQPNLFGEAPVLDLAASPPAQRIRKGQHADVRVISEATPVRADKAPAAGSDEDAPIRQRISIEHIHDVQRDAALKPFEGKARVFIIDGAENMSADAANALLKTLEEPAPEVFIVLVASSAEALPETIVSRCQRIHLRPVKLEVIEQKLVERFAAAPETAARLARLSRGRPGWAINALKDPAVLETYSQTALRIVSVVSGGPEHRFQYARDISGSFRRNREAVLGELGRWLEWWRDVAVVKAGLPALAVNVDWMPALEAMAKALTTDDIAAAAQTVKETAAALEANAIPRLALEVMVLELPHVAVPESAARP
jgi:DNA polymerase-3 subunit delta'